MAGLWVGWERGKQGRGGGGGGGGGWGPPPGGGGGGGGGGVFGWGGGGGGGGGEGDPIVSESSQGKKVEGLSVGWQTVFSFFSIWW